MEKEYAKLTAKPAETPTETPELTNKLSTTSAGLPSTVANQIIDFHVGAYSVKAALHNSNKLCISAYSESEGRMLEALIQNSDLAEKDRIVFEDCEGVYLMIEECLQEKRNIQLGDTNQLRFPYQLKSSKKTQVERAL